MASEDEWELIAGNSKSNIQMQIYCRICGIKYNFYDPHEKSCQARKCDKEGCFAQYFSISKELHCCPQPCEMQLTQLQFGFQYDVLLESNWQSGYLIKRISKDVYQFKFNAKEVNVNLIHIAPFGSKKPELKLTII